MSKLADVSCQPLVLIETPGLCLHEPSSLYAHCDGEQCCNYFLSEARLCASDPVPCFIQDCVKGESLGNPGHGHHWLRLKNGLGQTTKILKLWTTPPFLSSPSSCFWCLTVILFCITKINELSLCTAACTLNPLLSPLGGLLFSSTFEGGGGGLIVNFPPLKRGVLIREGGFNRAFTVSTFVDNLVLCVLLYTLQGFGLFL